MSASLRTHNIRLKLEASVLAVRTFLPSSGLSACQVERRLCRRRRQSLRLADSRSLGTGYCTALRYESRRIFEVIECGVRVRYFVAQGRLSSPANGSASAAAAAATAFAAPGSLPRRRAHLSSLFSAERHDDGDDCDWVEDGDGWQWMTHDDDESCKRTHAFTQCQTPAPGRNEKNG